MRLLDFFWITLIASILSACSDRPNAPQSSPELHQGHWRATLTNASGKAVPFNFVIQTLGGDVKQMLILTPSIGQPTDTLIVDEWITKGDTAYTFLMPVFDARIEATLQADGQLRGQYRSFSDGNERVLDFAAVPKQEFLFDPAPKPEGDVSGRWAVQFAHAGKTNDAIGVFAQADGQVTGTFLTKTGDYRFLAGQLNGQQLSLSAFDGEHIFLFEATLGDQNQLTDGHFYSGKGYHATWTATRNDTVQLPDPEKLTLLKDDATRLDFRLPDLRGDTVSLRDFAGRPVLLQILGSWCPNCMDETRFLVDFYRRNRAAGGDLEIIGLAFERTANDMSKAQARVRRMQERFEIPYPLLIAGLTADKTAAAAALPQLEAIVSYPTTIFINREGEVVKIHTGFSGPATGDAYTEWMKDFEQTIAQLQALP
ncbi:MAG: peroxiredoxin family protein [Bernardetiaceae bacterium]